MEHLTSVVHGRRYPLQLRKEDQFQLLHLPPKDGPDRVRVIHLLESRENESVSLTFQSYHDVPVSVLRRGVEASFGVEKNSTSDVESEFRERNSDVQ